MKLSPTHDLAAHAREYHHLGLTVLRGLVRHPFTEQWAEKAEALATLDRPGVHRLNRDATGEATETDAGGARRHTILDGSIVRAELPGLWAFYQLGLPLIAEQVVQRPVEVSRDLRSSVNVKLYSGKGGAHGHHYDSNAVTALLYLTPCGQAGMAPGTEVTDFTGATYRLKAYAGDVLLMQGRKVWHGVPENVHGHPRITCPLNLYHPDDHDRPAHQDALIYGEAAQAAG